MRQLERLRERIAQPRVELPHGRQKRPQGRGSRRALDKRASPRHQAHHVGAQPARARGTQARLVIGGHALGLLEVQLMQPLELVTQRLLVDCAAQARVGDGAQGHWRARDREVRLRSCLHLGRRHGRSELLLVLLPLLEPLGLPVDFGSLQSRLHRLLHRRGHSRARRLPYTRLQGLHRCGRLLLRLL